MLIVAVALGLALGIQAFLVKPYRIPSPSMEPTLDIGQRVLVNRIGQRFTDPGRNDVVVFNPPKGADGDSSQECGARHAPNQACPLGTRAKSDTSFIKRVIGLPGDCLSVRAGIPVISRVSASRCRQEAQNVGGEPLKEDFIRPCGGADGCTLPKPIVVPPDHYFMMGDNRGESDDSRFWGPVPRDWIIGKAFFTYWPPRRIGFL